MFEQLLPPILLWVMLAVFVMIMLWISFRSMTKWIIKVPPDKAVIVYGAFTKSRVNVLRKVPDDSSGNQENAYKLIKEEVEVSFKIIRGGATLVIPLLQEVKTLDLGLLTLEVKVEDVPSVQAVPITVDGIAQIKIGGDTTYIATAAEQLLDKSVSELQHVARETLMGHLRAIIGLMTVEETFKNREIFSQRVQEVAVEDMAGMGIEIKSFVIKDIDDKQGYIKALGAVEIQGKLRDERIAIATAHQLARESEANTDLVAQTAEILRDKKVIEQKESQELRAVEKDRSVDLAKANKDREVQEQRARAVEQQQQAEVIVPAEAEAKAKKIVADGERERITITATADAEATTKIGKAVAEANKAKLLAEADGTQAQLEAEAIGKLKIAEAIAAEDQINVRQMLAEAIINGEVKKSQALAEAIGLIGQNIQIVQFAGGESNSQGNALMNLLGSIPEFTAKFNAQTQALTGSNLEELLGRVMTLLKTGNVLQEQTISPVAKTKKPKKTTEKAPSTTLSEIAAEAIGPVLLEEKPEQQPPSVTEKVTRKRPTQNKKARL